MKNKSIIKVRVPDNLTEQEELVQVGKLLRQKMLSGGSQNKSQSKIGTEVNISFNKTIIEIERYTTEPVLKQMHCNVCGCEFYEEKNRPRFRYYHNYGGLIRHNKVCSSECQEIAISINPERIFKSRKQSSMVRLF